MSGVWDPLRAELDSDPPRDPALAATSYVVCSTPRSGSGLLCRGLASSGLAGSPAEYFNVNQRVPLAARWGTGRSLEAYTAALRSRRSSAAGLFGTKLHADQLEQIRAETCRQPDGAHALSAAFLERLLPGLRYVRIVRLDIDRQAVSLWSAFRSGTWSVREGAAAAPPAEVPYSFDGIERCRQMIVDGEIHWDRFMRFNAIAPVEVVFEELVASFAPTVAAALAAILGSTPEPAAIAPPDSVRQAGDRSDELYAQFAADRGNPAATPHVIAGPPRSVLWPGQALDARDALSSPNGDHQLVFAPGGRLVLHRREAPRWSTLGNGRRAASLLMQPDGDLVLLDADGDVLWSTRTAGHPRARAELQDDGKIVVRSVADEALWYTP